MGELRQPSSMKFIYEFSYVVLQSKLGEPLRRGRSLPPGDFIYGVKQQGSKNGVAEGKSVRFLVAPLVCFSLDAASMTKTDSKFIIGDCWVG